MRKKKLRKIRRARIGKEKSLEWSNSFSIKVSLTETCPEVAESDGSWRQAQENGVMISPRHHGPANDLEKDCWAK
jgi:hypothetical protein